MGLAEARRSVPVGASLGSFGVHIHPLNRARCLQSGVPTHVASSSRLQSGQEAPESSTHLLPLEVVLALYFAPASTSSRPHPGSSAACSAFFSLTLDSRTEVRVLSFKTHRLAPLADPFSYLLASSCLPPGCMFI